MSLTRYKVLYRITQKNTLIFSWNHSLRSRVTILLLNKSDRYTKKRGALYCCEYVSIHDLFAQNSREKKNFFTKSDVKVRVPPRKAKRLLKGST